MGNIKTIPYADALEGIEQIKHWPPQSHRINWVQESKNKWPHSYKSFVGLLHNEAYQEGTKVELFYKESVITGAPNTTYMNFFYQGALVFAVHEGPPTKHTNKVGKERKYYQKVINHPHKHIPVEESSYGYAEPLGRVSIDELWCLFKKEANIIGDIQFEFPQVIQGSLL